MIGHEVVVLQGCSVLQCNTSTQVKDLVAMVNSKYPVAEELLPEYSLFVVCTSVHPNGFWLDDPQKLVSSYLLQVIYLLSISYCLF